MNNNIEFVLYASYFNENEYLGRDIIEPLGRICQKYNLNLFKGKLKFAKAPVNTDGV